MKLVAVKTQDGKWRVEWGLNPELAKKITSDAKLMPEAVHIVVADVIEDWNIRWVDTNDPNKQ